MFSGRRKGYVPLLPAGKSIYVDFYSVFEAPVRKIKSASTVIFLSPRHVFESLAISLKITQISRLIFVAIYSVFEQFYHIGDVS